MFQVGKSHIRQHKANIMTDIKSISDDDFLKEVLEVDTPVLVDFWAEWCMPCKAIGPIIAQAAKEYSGKIKVVKINVDENKKRAGQYNVRGIPTLLLFYNGEVIDTNVGSIAKQQLDNFISKNLDQIEKQT